MILYRTMTSSELRDRLNGINKSTANVKGENTFKYDKDQEYIHFFKYAEHAFYYMKRIYSPYIMVAQCIIPDEVVSEMEFGVYGDIETSKNKALLGWYIPLPEYRIKKEDFKNEYIHKFATNLYSDMSYNCIDRKENELPPFDFNKEGEGISYRRLYSYADMYYEMLYSMAKTSSWDFEKIVKYLKRRDLNEEIEKYYQENKDLLMKGLDKKEKRKQVKRKVLDMFKK